jgi:hypothetical protein
VAAQISLALKINSGTMATITSAQAHFSEMMSA